MLLVVSNGIINIFVTSTSIISRRRQWHPTPVPLPGKCHEWRSLVGYRPWGREELDTTEWLHFRFSLSCIGEGNGNPLQCSCLKNPRDGGAWWAAVYGVAQSRTRLKRLCSSSIINSNMCKLHSLNTACCSSTTRAHLRSVCSVCLSLIGKDPGAEKDWRQKRKRAAEDEVVRCHHRLNGHELKTNSRKLWRTGETGMLWSMRCTRLSYWMTKSLL